MEAKEINKYLDKKCKVVKYNNEILFGRVEKYIMTDISDRKNIYKDILMVYDNDEVIEIKLSDIRMIEDLQDE